MKKTKKVPLLKKYKKNIKNKLNYIFIENHRLISLDFLCFNFEICSGWENAEGRFSISLFNFLWFKDSNDIFIFSITLWFLQCGLNITI